MACLERKTGGDAPIVLFRTAEGLGGHIAALALFRRDTIRRPRLHPAGEHAPETEPASSLHHLGLSLLFAEQAAVMVRDDRIAQPCRVDTFGWLGWRGMFAEDPEGDPAEPIADEELLLG